MAGVCVWCYHCCLLVRVIMMMEVRVMKEKGIEGDDDEEKEEEEEEKEDTRKEEKNRRI